MIERTCAAARNISLVAFVALFLLAGCVGSNQEYRPLLPGKFGPRATAELVDFDLQFGREPSPGDSNSSNAIRLMQAQRAFALGYLPIGNVTRDVECDNAEACDRFIDVMVAQTARRGGDWLEILWTMDVRTADRRRGKCLEMGLDTKSEYVCRVGEGCGYMDVVRTTCVKHDTVYSDTFTNTRTIVGTHWRHEPEIARNFYLASGLAIAVRSMDIAGIQSWLDHGADISFPFAESPIKRLLEATHGANKKSPRIQARRLEVVRFLISKGADPNYFTSLWANTPLIEAISQDDYEMVMLLLQNGASTMAAKFSSFRGVSCDGTGNEKLCSARAIHELTDESDPRVKAAIYEATDRALAAGEAPVVLPRELDDVEVYYFF